MFFGNLFKKSISVDYQFYKDGIVLCVFLKYKNNKKTAISFPLDENFLLKKYLKRLSLESQQKLVILQQLWNEEILYKNKENCYLIQYNNLYKIDNKEREILGLPKDMNNLKIKIWSEGIITSPDFKIKYDIYMPSGKKLINYSLIENIISIEKTQYLIAPHIYELISHINNFPYGKSIEEIAGFLSLLKSKANNEDVLLEDYLKNEDYMFIEDIDYKIEKIEEDQIKIEPVILNQYEKNPEINNIFSNGQVYLEKIKTLPMKERRVRIFSSDNAIKKYNSIRSISSFKGSEIPKLIENPELFLPDWIDLENFSDRVKEIGIQIYHIRPSLKLKEDTRTGLFDLIATIRLESSDNHYSEEMPVENILPILKSSEDEYIKLGNKWIKNDREEVENFKKRLDVVSDKYNQLKIPKSEMKFVLEIFENISQLEYNETFLNYKLQISKEDLEFERPKLINDDIDIKNFQKDGINWLKTLYKNSIGGILADEMGLGKTFQVIAFLAYLKEINQLKPSLIVLPLTLIANWESEINKFAPALSNNLYIHRGGDRLRRADEIANYDIVITTYETLVKDQLMLAIIDWRVLICDEAQNIKNHDAYRTKVAKALKAKTRIAMTGTPLENGLSEFWCIMDFAQPGLLDCYSKFKERFEDPILHSNTERSEQLNQKLLATIKPHYLRRTKDENLDGLPKKISKIFTVEMTNFQKKIYKKIISDYNASELKKQIRLETLNKLIYTCDCPEILISNSFNNDVNKLIDECAKLKKLCELLDTIKQKDEKVLIFTRFKIIQTMLASVIQKRYGIYTNILNGELPGNRRMQIINKFSQTHGFNVLILNSQVGGVGLNITSANHVIHYTREWNPAKEDQATDRAYRIGQQKDVYVYYIITTAPSVVKKTIDEHIHNLLEAKRVLFKEVVVPNKLEITEDELDEVLMI